MDGHPLLILIPTQDSMAKNTSRSTQGTATTRLDSHTNCIALKAYEIKAILTAKAKIETARKRRVFVKEALRPVL